MTRPLLVCRPQPGADATAARARAMGMEVLVHPLFTVEPIAWEAPDPAAFDALMLTSANALRHGGGALTRYHRLPVFAVGEATARAASAAGFPDITIAGPDAQGTMDRIVRAGHRHVLHLCGEDVRSGGRPELEIVRRAVYRSVETAPAEELDAMLDRRPVILVHSPRAGARLAALIAPARRENIALIAISPAACETAGARWERAAAADCPGDSGMLALARPLCL